MSSSYGSGYRRRSPYAPLGQDDQGYLSPYSPYGYGQGGDEGMNPLMRDAVYRNQMEGSRYQGGVGANQLDALSGLDAGGSTAAPEAPGGGGGPLDEGSFKSAYAAASGSDAMPKAQSGGGESSDESDSTEGAPGTKSFSTTPASTSKYATAGNASWLTSAPEAAGAGAFSTTPEDRPPRSQEPITKAEVQRTGAGTPAVEPKPTRSEAWQAVDKKTAEIEKIQKGLSGWAAPLIAMAAPGAIHQQQSQVAQLQSARRDLIAQAQYDDNRRGMIPKGRPFEVVENGVTVKYQMLANGQKQRMGEAPVPPIVQAARVRGEWVRDVAGGKVKPFLGTLGGKKGAWISGPGGGVQPFGPEVQDEGPPEEGKAPPSHVQQFEDLGEGGARGGTIHNLPENVPSYIDASGKVQKNPNYVAPADRKPGAAAGEKEDPIEKRAASAAQAAMQKALFAAPEDEAGAQAVYRNTYAAVKSTLTKGKAGDMAPEIQPGTVKNFRDKKDPTRVVPFRLDKKGKWQPVVGPVAASHGQ